jgi:hypothetical protein
MPSSALGAFFLSCEKPRLTEPAIDRLIAGWAALRGEQSLARPRRQRSPEHRLLMPVARDHDQHRDGVLHYHRVRANISSVPNQRSDKWVLRILRSLPTAPRQSTSELLKTAKPHELHQASWWPGRIDRSTLINYPLASLGQAIRGIERIVKHKRVVLNPVSYAIRQAGKAAAGQTVAREPEAKLYDPRSKLPASTTGKSSIGVDGCSEN